MFVTPLRNGYVNKRMYAEVSSDEVQSSKTVMKKHKKADDDDDDDDESSSDDVYTIGTAVYFNTGVNRDSVAKLRKQLRQASEIALKNSNTIDEPTIVLYVTSNGGDVFAGFTACHFIQRNPVKVITVADGYVASAATFILLASKTRYIVPGSHVRIHQLSTVAFGKFDEISDDHKNCQYIMKRMETMYKSETSLPDKKIKKLLKSELDLTDAQCVKYGVVTSILE